MQMCLQYVYTPHRNRYAKISMVSLSVISYDLGRSVNETIQYTCTLHCKKPTLDLSVFSDFVPTYKQIIYVQLCEKCTCMNK